MLSVLSVLLFVLLGRLRLGYLLGQRADAGQALEFEGASNDATIHLKDYKS